MTEFEGNFGEDSGLARQAVRSVGARYAILVVGLAISVLLSRELAASGRGSYAYVIALASTIAWVAHLSIETSLTLAWSDAARRPKLVGAALASGLVVGISAALIMAVWTLVSHPFLPDGVALWVLVAALATTPATLIVLYSNAILANDGRVDEINHVALYALGVQLVVLVSVIALGVLSVTSAVMIWMLGAVVPLAWLLPKALRAPGAAWPGMKQTGGLILTGLKYHSGSVALALIFRVDILLLGTRVDIAQVGIYSLAVALVELSMVATSASSQVALQVQVRGDPRDHGEFTAAVARVNAILASGLLLGMILLGPWTISRVFGESYVGTTVPVFLLAPGVLALAVQRPLGVYVTRLGRPFFQSVGMVCGLAANVALNLALIPRWGIRGAAVASTIVYLGLLIWTAVWFKRSTGLALGALLPRLSDAAGGWAALRQQLKQ